MAENNVDSICVSDVLSDVSQCVYTACYCEENVWKLADFVRENCPAKELSKCFCVFISNDSRKDYHVILVYQHGGRSLVFDLDTELSFPCTVKEYATACLGDERTLKEEYRRMFRVVPASEFLSTFASDRSHMVNEKGEWMAPPPQYPPICCEGSTNNIEEFISMSPDFKHGRVMDLATFLKMFLQV
ncbi:protein n-terminal glutamine amidohydrolase-like [Plakobranchus ocellatus]|uniref:Protein N-terminal glutamine amidohydrolase n=1 Tax=Plakobranchus ocellatus TaxID=259542 RepID=A0AAV4CUC9_9GAST|nr:protein n-terminal glutamine amidohydrolase-like [Plakobranchus ocellatus]